MPNRTEFTGSGVAHPGGEITMSQGFIAQYAAEAAMRSEGVAGLEEGGAASIKSAFGFEHEGEGVLVNFTDSALSSCEITVYPIIYFRSMVPDVAFSIQENVKADVERYTGLNVQAVHVYVKDIIPVPEDGKEEFGADGGGAVLSEENGTSSNDLNSFEAVGENTDLGGDSEKA